tara:strand:- start:6662 stop:7402 length:741 start_codon:yes stop_codon:yes gene_type:complete
MRESWQDFQADFGRYLRDPEQEKLPDGVAPRRAKVYEELLFNNVRGFLNSCFPICKTLIDKDEWTNLARDFFRDWRCHSPRFNDIPKEFLDYLSSDISPELSYPWMLQLAHYEWVELAVDTFDESGVEVNSSIEKGSIYVNPTLHNLIYDWPVHQISPDYLPTEQKPSFLLVYRNSENEVAFTEVNAATSALMNLFEQGCTKSQEVLSELASQMKVPFNDAFNAFGLEMINQLIAQGMLFDVQASI